MFKKDFKLKECPVCIVQIEEPLGFVSPTTGKWYCCGKCCIQAELPRP